MPEYRAYLISSNGRIQQRIELVCEDETTAKERAKQLVDGHDVELWQGIRKIAIFPRQH
jgi:hypothetical protein